MTTKTFHLGELLSVTTGVLMSPKGIGGVYDILNWMSSDDLFTHQLPRVCDECKPYLLKQFPRLAGADLSGITPENFTDRLAGLVSLYGEFFEVEKLPKDAHEFIDPQSELAEKIHPDKMACAVEV